MGQEQCPCDASQRAGQGRNDDEEIEPRLKIDDDQQIDQHDRAEQPEDQFEIGVLHQLGLAMDLNLSAARFLVLQAMDNLFDVHQHGAEIALFSRDIDVD